MREYPQQSKRRMALVAAGIDGAALARISGSVARNWRDGDLHVLTGGGQSRNTSPVIDLVAG